VVALEEAATLEALFKGVEAAEVEDRLRLYNDVMLDHVQVVHLLSDAPPFAESEFRERAAKVSKRPIFPSMTPQFTRPIQDFFYGYDAFEEARKGLELGGKGN
jgi:hypothetical protein